MISRFTARVRQGARSDLAKTSMLVFVALIAAAAFTYGFYLIVGHTLSVAEYGTVTSLISVVMLASTPAAIGQTIVAKAVAAGRVSHMGYRARSRCVRRRSRSQRPRRSLPLRWYGSGRLPSICASSVRSRFSLRP